MTTGPATWYEATDPFAWSAVDDTTPAVMNPSKGAAITPGTPATAVTGGWDMSGVANYQGGHGGTLLAYTDSPLFAIVSRVDDDTSSFAIIAQYGLGSGDFVSFTTFTGPARIAVDWNGATGAQHVGNTHGHSTSLEVHWCWIDNANLKVYTGVNLFALPFTASAGALSGAEGAINGKACKAGLSGGGAQLTVTNYDNTYPGANGVSLVLTGVLEVA